MNARTHEDTLPGPFFGPTPPASSVPFGWVVLARCTPTSRVFRMTAVHHLFNDAEQHMRDVERGGLVTEVVTTHEAFKRGVF